MPNVHRPKNITAVMDVTVVISNPSPKEIGFLSAVVATVVMEWMLYHQCFLDNHGYSFIVYFSKAYDVVLVVDPVFH